MTRINTQAAEQTSELNSKLGTVFTTIVIALAGFLAFATFAAAA